jgi:hypothetical protein
MFGYTPIARQRVNKQVPAKETLGIESVATSRNYSDSRGVFNMVCPMPSVKKQNSKHVYNNRCSLWGPCRRDSEDRLQSVRAKKSSRKEVVGIQL